MLVECSEVRGEDQLQRSGVVQKSVTVHVAFDLDASVWYVEEANLPGLSGEAETLEALIERLPVLVTDLIEENGFVDGAQSGELPIEVIAHRTTSAHYSTAA
jgi:hypothetical protein